MHRRIFLLGFTYSLRFSVVEASSGECTDLHGRTITPGLHYVPGPDSCTLCVCDGGSPKWCKAVLCSPPQDCKSFRLGNSCCEFICLDTLETLLKPSSDHGGGESTTDLGLRLIAYAVTVVLFLSLFFFLVHRFRQRKIRGRQNRQLSEDERSLGSIGYIAGSLAYLPGSMGYLGSASQERHLEFRYEEPPVHFSMWKPPGNYFPRGEAPPPYEEAVAAARAEAALAAAVSSGTGVSSSGIGSGHRTIPINLATSGSFRIEPPITPVPEYRLRPSPPEPLPITVPDAETSSAIRSDVFYEDVLIAPPLTLVSVECFNTTASSGNKNRVSTISVPSELPLPPSSVLDTLAEATGESSTATSSRIKLNDLNKNSLDSGTCSCSYQCLPPPPALNNDDTDDYRSECENCKSTQGSRYYLDEEPGGVSPQETMTLHRRPQEYEQEQSYYRTSLTLPTHTRRTRTGPLHNSGAAPLNGARENWFSSMPASSTSSTSSEEEE